MAKIVTMHDVSGDTIYPQTTAEAVFRNDPTLSGQTVEETLTSLEQEVDELNEEVFDENGDSKISQLALKIGNSNAMLEQGGIDSKGNKTESNSRVRFSQGIVGDFYLSLNEGYYIRAIYKFNQDGTYNSYMSYFKKVVLDYKDESLIVYPVINKINDTEIISIDEDIIGVFASGDIPLNMLNVSRELEGKITELDNEVLAQRIAYVSPNGSDNNDGSKSNPFLSFQNAIDKGFTQIVGEAGIYKGQTISATGKSNICIRCCSATDMERYTDDHVRKGRIVLDNSIDISGISSYDTILRAPLTVASNHTYHKVFISKELSANSGSAVSESYNAVLWEIGTDISKHKKLVPVLSVAECKATIGSFTFDGSYIYINPINNGASYKRLNKDATNVNGMSFTNIDSLVIEGVDMLFYPNKNALYNNVVRGYIKDCDFGFSGISTGSNPTKSNITFVQCNAYHNGTDGFAVSGNGNCSYYNCNSIYNNDDGLSHHDGCEGAVFGGYWAYNKKGGITPSYGSNVQIYNAVCEYNNVGLYYLADNSTVNGEVRKTDKYLVCVGCVSVNNITYDLRLQYYNVTANNCIYNAKYVSGTSNLIENNIQSTNVDLDSITNQLTDAVSRIDIIEKLIDNEKGEKVEIELEQGGINGNGINMTSSVRVRTKDFIEGEIDLFVSEEFNIRNVVYYNADGSFNRLQSNTTMQVTSFKYSGSLKIKLVFERVDGAELLPSDVVIRKQKGADLQKLSERVDAIEEKIEQGVGTNVQYLDDAYIKSIKDLVVFYGACRTDGGLDIEDITTRVRSDFFIARKGCKFINKNSADVVMVVYIYSDNNYRSYVRNKSVGSTEYVLDDDTWVRCVFGYKDNRQIDSISDLMNNYSIEGNTNLLAVSAKSLTLNRSKTLGRKIASIADYISDGDFVEQQTTESLYALWDGLMAQYPEYITKKVLGKDASGTYDLLAYTVKSYTDNYTETFSGRGLTNLKIVLMPNIHGGEWETPIDDFRFIKELIEKRYEDETMNTLWSNCEFVIVPTCNPWGLTNNSRYNANAVNLNRNFPNDWKYYDPSDAYNYAGASAADQVETKILMKFIKDNSDAFLITNRHTSGSGLSASANSRYGYFSSFLRTDNEVGYAICKRLDTLMKKRWNWLLDVELNKHRPMMIVNPKVQHGTMDGFINECGIHGSLLEFGQYAYVTEGYPQMTQDVIQDIDVTIMANYLYGMVANNEYILSSNDSSDYQLVN